MPHTALAEILDLAGVASPEARQLEIRGADPVLPLADRIGTAGAASLAAVGLAAARLWKLRAGRSQSVAVDTRAAAISLRSARYLRINGQPPPPPWDPLTPLCCRPPLPEPSP